MHITNKLHMKKISIFCLLVLFTQISMAQMDIDKEWTISNIITEILEPTDTVEIKSNDQTYRMIKSANGAIIFQNKKTTYLDYVSNRSSNEKWPEATLDKPEEIYKSFKDNISLYINPDTLLERSQFLIYITSDMKGNIKDVVFIYASELNIPEYVLSNIERDIKKKSRLIFQISPTTQMNDFVLYSGIIRKDSIVSFGI